MEENKKMVPLNTTNWTDYSYLCIAMDWSATNLNVIKDKLEMFKIVIFESLYNSTNDEDNNFESVSR